MVADDCALIGFLTVSRTALDSSTICAQVYTAGWHSQSSCGNVKFQMLESLERSGEKCCKEPCKLNPTTFLKRNVIFYCIGAPCGMMHDSNTLRGIKQ